MKARELFDELAGLDDERREARLAELGDEHADVVAKVRRLLAASESTGSFLESGSAADLFESVDDDVRRRIGDYRIGDILGRGGMGMVYRAEQDHPRRSVALKILPASRLSGEALERFENEAHALARLRHAAITQVYEAGSEDGADGYVHFIAMELVDGRTLARWAEVEHPLDERLELIAAVADGLHHAHEQGVIHRDVKPSNILVRSDGTPKILDFGVARLVDRDHTLTRAGQVVGTLAYMSPEQANSGEDVDTRSDQYSLGVVAYELLTGHLPVDVSGCSLTDAAMRVRERRPLPPTRHDGRLHRDVDVVLSKALAKERGERYPSLAEFAADLRRVANREPIAARPPTLAESLARLARRHRVAALAAVVSTTFFIGASILLTTKNRALSQTREDLDRSLGEEAAARILADERGEELAGKNAELARNNAKLEKALAAARSAEEQATEARDEAQRNAEQAAAQMLVFERWLKGGAGEAKVPTPQTTLLEATRELAESAGRITSTGFPAAFAYLTIAELCSQMGLRKEARENLQRAMENTRGRARNDVERTQALIIRQTHAVHLHNDGDTAAAIATLERSLDIVERLDGEVADLWELRINSYLASWLADVGREDEARGVLAEVEELFDETDGDMRSEVAARMRIALAHSDLGDWDTASRRMLEIVEVTRGKIEVASQHRHALAQAAAIELAHGRVEVAERLARESVEACRSGATNNQRANAHFVLGGVLARQDKHGEAIREFSRALELKSADPVRGAEFLSHRSRSQHGAGHGKRAVTDATRALRVLDERGQRGRLLDLALDSLVVVALDSEPETALEAAERLCHIRRQADPGSTATFEAELHRVAALRRLTRVEDAFQVVKGLEETATKIGARDPELLKRYRSVADELAGER